MPPEVFVQVETEAVTFLPSSAVAVAKPFFTRLTIAIKRSQRIAHVCRVSLTYVLGTKLRHAFEARFVEIVKWG